MKTNKKIRLDRTKLHGFKIAAQSLNPTQRPAVLGSKIGSPKKTDTRIGSKIGIIKRY